jgi:hypothetical protein
VVGADGLALVATWEEPFSLEGEDLSYVITIMNNGNVVQNGVTVNTTTYVLSEPIGERDCSEYQFTVFSRNSFGKSQTGMTGVANIPTGWKNSNSLSLSLSLSLFYLPLFSPTPQVRKSPLSLCLIFLRERSYFPHFTPTLFPRLRLLYFLSSSPFCT